MKDREKPPGWEKNGRYGKLHRKLIDWISQRKVRISNLQAMKVTFSLVQAVRNDDILELESFLIDCCEHAKFLDAQEESSKAQRRK
jgi:hypothetical protein